MRSEIVLFIVVGLSSPITARPLLAVERDNQKHLFKRQMENNPFAPKPINTSPVTIRITNEELAAGEEEEGQGEPGTPAFSSHGDQQGGENLGTDEEEVSQNDGSELEPPSFGGIGMGQALDSVDLGPLGHLEGSLVNVEPNPGELEYEYASFDFDDEEMRKRIKEMESQCKNNQPAWAPPNRPYDNPKYDLWGRRMGYILNEGYFGDDGPMECHPYWGVIREGHEVAEEPLFDDDDEGPAFDRDQVNEYILSLMMSEIRAEQQDLQQSDEEEFYDIREPTEEEERMIKEALQDQARADPRGNQGGVTEQERVTDETLLEQISADEPRNQGQMTGQNRVDDESLQRQSRINAVSDQMEVSNRKGDVNQDEDEVQEFVADIAERIANADNDEGGGVDDSSVSSRSGGTIGEPRDELVDEQLKTIAELLQEPMDINRVARIDSQWINKQAARTEPNRSRQQQVAVVRGEEHKSDPPQVRRTEAEQYYSNLPQSGGDSQDVDRSRESRNDKGRSKSPLRRFGNLVGSGVKTLITKVTGHGGPHSRSKIEYIKPDPQAPPIILNQETVQTGVQDIAGNKPPVINQQFSNEVIQDSSLNYNSRQPPLERIAPSWGTGIGREIYNVPSIDFGGSDDEDEVNKSKLPKSFYRKRLRK